ncbi:DUF2339 domain-containing protein [Candidatus Kaiserbacteria bacterium]|nr:DUF2339 domain-containing protein [Candidatus Kaiserbacteria bacterium]USN88677.1 MAG: DUF2339 domain-containing protein [Candidatus Nomurabacteria bacterium]
MDNVYQRLIVYIREQLNSGVSVRDIYQILLDNQWSPEQATAAFADLGIDIRDHVAQTRIPAPVEQETVIIEEKLVEKSFVQEELTMDKIIDKFIPIAGALFLIIGFGYLIYANAWIHLSMEIRLTLGFFFSVVIIGGSFSFSERMRYFTDIGIGSGILLLYGTLIYGSRTTDLATAMIPEVVTLVTALLFTIAIAYFASKRSSKVILMLGMIGAYITPFVIGQNDVWVENISFNAYLLYFLAINAAVFLMGREISVREVIPLNIAGLFIGVTTLWGLSASDDINQVHTGDFFTSELFTAVLFAVLVGFSILSILLSAKRFKEQDDGYLSLGYIAPVIWFALNVSNLETVPDVAIGLLYAFIAGCCFTGWHILQDTETKFQHTAVYAAGLLSAFLAVFALFDEFNVYTSMLMAYSSLIFGVLYMTGAGKLERFVSYTIVSLTGSVLSMKHILEASLDYETLLVVIALIPAMLGFFIARKVGDQRIIPAAAAYSFVWTIVASLFVIAEFIDYIDVDFLLFYLTPLSVLLYLVWVGPEAQRQMSHDVRSRIFRVIMVWFGIGFIAPFFMLVTNVYPAPTNVYLFTHPEMPIDWLMIKGTTATAIMFIGLWLSRQLQKEQVIKRPSFILVIFGFSTLLLTGNYLISAIANDLNIAHIDGGPRALATTLWWAAIAIFMLYKGIKLGRNYHSEKLLGLLLLGITLIKVILYDIATMSMQSKIIVLMMVGGAMLLFSYFVKSKNLLKPEETD